MQHFFSKTRIFWWRCDALAFCIVHFFAYFWNCYSYLCCTILQQPLFVFIWTWLEGAGYNFFVLDRRAKAVWTNRKIQKNLVWINKIWRRKDFLRRCWILEPRRKEYNAKNVQKNKNSMILMAQVNKICPKMCAMSWNKTKTIDESGRECYSLLRERTNSMFE